MRQIDRLLQRAGRNQELEYCEVFLDDEDYSFYVKPLTMAQLVEATKSIRKGETLTELEQTIKLFVLRALDANGQRQYQADAFNILMRLPIDDLNKLAGAMKMTKDEEEPELSIKSLNDGTEEGGQPDSRVSSGRKARSNTK